MGESRAQGAGQYAPAQRLHLDLQGHRHEDAKVAIVLGGQLELPSPHAIPKGRESPPPRDRRPDHSQRFGRSRLVDGVGHHLYRL